MSGRLSRSHVRAIWLSWTSHDSIPSFGLAKCGCSTTTTIPSHCFDKNNSKKQ